MISNAFSRGRRIALVATAQIWLGTLALQPATAQAPATAESQPQDPTSAPVHATSDVAPSNGLTLSADPMDDEIIGSQLFHHPLIPVGQNRSADENRALAVTLREFVKTPGEPAAEVLQRFAQENPNSRWTAALHFNLALIYHDEGYFRKAEREFAETWRLTKNATAPLEKALADRAVAELANLYAGFGRMTELEQLVRSAEGRTFGPGARQKWVEAREKLNFAWYMPDHAYSCGTEALRLLHKTLAPGAKHPAELVDPDAPVGGYTLRALKRIAAKAQMESVVAKRPVGADFPVPCVIHWNWGHYSALMGRRGDKYLLKDGALGRGRWISKAALDAETSGYLLVPGGKAPKEWQAVSDSEAELVVGGCHVATCDDDRDGECSHSTDDHHCGGMAQYKILLMTCGLSVSDTPLSYKHPSGTTIPFTITYEQREANQPIHQTYSNLGPLWTFNWMSYVVDNPTDPAADVDIYDAGGGTDTFTGWNQNLNGDPATAGYAAGTVNGIEQYCFCSGSFAPDLYTQSTLTRNCTTCSGVYSAQTGALIGVSPTLRPLTYTRTYSDGTIQTYGLPGPGIGEGRHVYLTNVQMPDGTSITLTYDSNYRVTHLTDSVGKVTTLNYGLASDIYKLTSVSDPFGRAATFQYNSSGRLSSSTDPMGIVSQYHYDATGFLDKMTTPYGDTVFTEGETDPGTPNNVRWLEATDPAGGTERVEYSAMENANIPTDIQGQWPAGVAVWSDVTVIGCRNTYYWNKEAMMQAPYDYSACHIYHWLDSDPLGSVVSDILEAEKSPLENWIFYNYPGQDPYQAYIAGTSAQPSAIGRVLDDNSPQVSWFSYNSVGNLTQAIDPVGRTTNYVYDGNGIDLHQVTQVNGNNTDLVRQYGTYNSLHLPASVTDAANQTYSYTYNAIGQVLTVTDPLLNVTTFGYDAQNHLHTVTGPGNVTLGTFSYDTVGRVNSRQGSDGYLVNYAYDNLDRPILSSYPDGTFDQNVYNLLDLEWTQDRAGRWTFYTYDAARHLTGVLDPQNNWTAYDVCPCGALRGILDPNGNCTSFQRDVQGRLRAKIYADQTQVTYTYENTTSRLLSIAEPNGVTKTYSYYPDGLPASLFYTIPAAQPPIAATPNLNYVYGQAYPRLYQVSAVGGDTLTYSYFEVGGPGAGQVSSVTGGPYALSYTYDHLGRVAGRTVDAENTESYQYDALGRSSGVSNALGPFTYAYVGGTTRLSAITNPSSPIATNFSYNPLPADPQLSSIQNTLTAGGNSVLSQHAYLFDSVGNIQSWTQTRNDGSHPTQYAFGYDATNQLTGATLYDTTTQTEQAQYAYGYDPSGNRNITQQGGVPVYSGFNNLNQMIATQIGGAGNLIIQGNVNKVVSSLTVNGVATGVSYDQSKGAFQAFVPSQAGSNTITVTGTDASNNQVLSKSYQVNVPAVTNVALSYDTNGNLTADGNGRTYEWDAENRLHALNYAGTTKRTEFTYNALGWRASIVEKDNGAVITTRKLVCDRGDLLEERDIAGGITTVKQYFQQGESVTGARYYYTRDQLQSVQEVVDSVGVVQGRYSYDPYGRSTYMPGPDSIESSFGYTGLFRYAFQSEVGQTGLNGLYIAEFRQYDPNLGRWIGRDPIEEEGGLDLYAYVENNPVNWADLTGLSGTVPDPNPVVPGGPWTPHNADRPGQFLGPSSGSGGRPQCQWVPPDAQGGPPGSKGYWKTNKPGQKGWDRYDQQGNPITPAQAHPAPPLPTPAATPQGTPNPSPTPSSSSKCRLRDWLDKIHEIPFWLFVLPVPGNPVYGGA